MMVTQSRPRRDSLSETPLLRPRLRLRTPEVESDTLETRTKLTSHSALECGGLPQLPDSS